jgi:hypothetical protein
MFISFVYFICDSYRRLSARAQKNMDKNAVAAVCTAVVEDMNSYGIGREDLQETLWTLNTYGRFDEAAIPTAVKSALTRTCTKIGKVFSLDALVKSVSSADAEGALADDDGLVAEEASEVRKWDACDDVGRHCQCVHSVLYG